MSAFGYDDSDFDKYAEGDLVYVLWEVGTTYEDADAERDEIAGVIHHIDRADSSLPWAVSRCDENDNWDNQEWGWYADSQVKPRRPKEFIIFEEQELVE